MGIPIHYTVLLIHNLEVELVYLLITYNMGKNI